ncbi:MAG: choice-of-anchor V domain-containing protein [Bryobacteraceae bacterium]
MKQSNKILGIKVATIFSVIPILMMGHDSGADPGNTGAPGDQTCAQSGCHVGTATQGSGVSIDFGSQGATYQPGVEQTWTITVNGAQTAGYGFQVSARLASDERNAQAGSFAAVDGTVQVICRDGVIKTATRSCRADAAIEYPTHTMPSRTGTFMLKWTPPATASGDVKVYVAGNAVNLNGQPSGDRIFTNSFTLTAAAGLQFKAPQTRSSQPLLQAFDNSGRLSGGTWIQVFGTDFAPVTRSWRGDEFSGAQAPTSLDGVRVNVNGKPAYVAFISPTQVNAQAPTDDSVGPVEVEVINPAGSSKITMTKTKVSPAMLEHPLWLSGSTKYVVALFPDFATFVGRTGLVQGVSTRPAKPGDTMIIYGVGCGAPGGEVIAGQRNITLPVEVRFGNTVATAQSFFAPGAVGLCQYNVTVPNLGAGDVAIELSVDGVATGQNLSTTIQP